MDREPLGQRARGVLRRGVGDGADLRPASLLPVLDRCFPLITNR